MERCYSRPIALDRVVVHHSTVIPAWCRKVHQEIPVVAPALAIYQLAATASRERVARAMDNGWAQGLFDGRTFDRLLDRLARSGRNGTVLIRELRQLRPDDWTPPASNLESRFNELAEANGFRFRRQVNIGDDEVWTGRVDFLADDCPLIVEILSERYHTSLTDREADEARRQRQTQLGYLVVEVWDYEIFYTPWLVVERILQARAALLRRSPRRNRP
jgi:very-short-patch-repair endonuclease